MLSSLHVSLEHVSSFCTSITCDLCSRLSTSTEWQVNMFQLKRLHLFSTALIIICLSGIISRARATEGYVSQGGLIWMPMSFQKTWADANTYCKNTIVNGQTGWRLPSHDELSALYASGVLNGQEGVLDFTWSSTPDSDSAHYYVNLHNGYVHSYFDTVKNYVTCVR